MIKITYPRIGDYDVAVNYFLTKALKCEIVKPPKITERTISLGNKYSSSFVCTPFKYTLGTFIESAEKGANTFIQLGGGCRYGYYGEVQEKILKSLGYDATVITLVINSKPKIKRIYKNLKKISKKLNLFSFFYYGFITLKMVKYMDIIDDYIRENMAFEMNRGDLLKLKELMLLDFEKIKGLKDLINKFKYYKEEFKNVHIRKPNNYYKVGIIGELYTIMEPNANQFLENELSKNNIEIKRFTNATYLLLEKKKFIRKYLKYLPVKYRMGADATDNIIHTKYLCDEKYDGIIHIKSSFCTPEIAAMPIINKIAEEKKVPVLYFSYDESTSEIGVKTRLEAFYDMLEMRNRK